MTDIETDTPDQGEAPDDAPPGPPPVMIGEPWFFPDTVLVPKVAPHPDDFSTYSTDHHVVSRPSRLGKTWQVGLLSCIVIVVLVALMITGGRALRSTASTTRPNVPAPSGVPSTWAAYRDPDRAFLIWHPPTWVVDRSGASTDITDTETSTRLRVDHTDPIASPPESRWVEAEKTFAAAHPDYVRLQMAATTYGGAPAALWEYSYSEDGRPVHAANLGFSTPKNGYTLSFQTPEQDWNRLLPLFTAFKTSFRIPPDQ